MKVKKNLVLLSTKPETCDYEIVANASLIFILLADRPWVDKPLLRFKLAENGASLIFLSLVLGKKQGQYNFKTEIIHAAKHTTSRQIIKAAMSGSCVTDFEGMIYIDKNADYSDAYMTHKALLMSSKAKSNALPSLEILANEVKAGHASAIGKPDKETIFYLMSRGISNEAANSLLVEAFFAETADHAPLSAEKEMILKWINKVTKPVIDNKAA